MSRAAATALASLLSACASAPPLPPSPPLPARFAGAAAEPIDAAWWQRFADPTLQRLLAAQAQGNLSLRQQLERVQQARAGARAQGARGWPSLALNGSASDARSDLPDAVKQRGQPDVRALRATLDLQWELDLFGAAAASRRAAEFDARSAESGREGLRLLLQVELAQHYLAWQSARRRQPLLQQLVDSQQASLTLARQRAAEGLAPAGELRGLEAELAALRAQQPALELLRESSLHRIALLLGRPAGSALPELDGAASALPVLPPLPPGQPAELLLRRPDLRAAAARRQAEAERAQQAEAERWPRLFLAGFWGRQDLRLNGSDLAPVPFQQLALAFSAPLFSAGRLQGVAEAQAAAARAAAWAEQEAVLTALAEVESALQQRLAGLARQQALQAQALARAAQRHQVERLWQEGLSARAPLLAATRGQLAAELELEQADWATRLDALQLAKALGGGWNPETPR